MIWYDIIQYICIDTSYICNPNIFQKTMYLKQPDLATAVVGLKLARGTPWAKLAWLLGVVSGYTVWIMKKVMLENNVHLK